MSGPRPLLPGEYPAPSRSNMLDHTTFVPLMRNTLYRSRKDVEMTWQSLQDAYTAPWDTVIGGNELSVGQLNNALGETLYTTETLNTQSLALPSGLSRHMLYGLVSLEHRFGDPHEALPAGGVRGEQVTPDNILVYAQKLGVTPSNHHQESFRSLFRTISCENGNSRIRAQPLSLPQSSMDQEVFAEAFRWPRAVLSYRLNIGLYYAVLKYSRATKKETS